MIRLPALFLSVLMTWWLFAIILTIFVPPPASVSIAGAPRPIEQLTFLHDDSWVDEAGRRVIEQSIFDSVFAAIDNAEQFIYLDVFLFNDWQGPVPETTRALSGELTRRLTEAAKRVPAPQIVVVTDPINTVYGGAESTHLDALRAAGIEVVLTDLVPLQDSNVLWSSLWRWFVRPFGNRAGHGTAPNPFTEGRVSIRSWLALLNFKANHRKLAIIDDPGPGTLSAWVMSANPHDGSSAHRNVALKVTGPVVHDLLSAERQVPGLDAQPAALHVLDEMLAYASHDQGKVDTADLPSVAVVNESAIRDSVVEAISSLQPGDAVDLEMFYLADRPIVRALGDAAQRGASVRVLLDVNADAFGRPKNGVPNRPVAHELTRNGVEVRWCATVGEQCHAKWFHARHGDTHTIVSGSGNFTRRNLGDFNLETDLVIRAPSGYPVLEAMLARYERLWNNERDRTYSLSYDTFADDSPWLTFQYRFMETTGLSTF